MAAARVAKLDETMVELRQLSSSLAGHPDDAPEWEIFGHSRGDWLDEETGEGFSETHPGDSLNSEEILWQDTPLFVLETLVYAKSDDETYALERQLEAWLREDPDHWQAFRGLVFDSWQTKTGRCRKDTPRWVAVLGSFDVVTTYGGRLFPFPAWVAHNQLLAGE